MSGVFPPTRPPSAATLPARGRDLRGALSRNADAAPSLPARGRDLRGALSRNADAAPSLPLTGRVVREANRVG